MTTEMKPRRWRELDDAYHHLLDGDVYAAILLDALLYRQAEFHNDGALDKDGYFYRSRQKLSKDCLGWLTNGVLERRIKALAEHDWFDCYNPDDPQQARRFRVDVVALRKVLAADGYAVPRWPNPPTPREGNDEPVRSGQGGQSAPDKGLSAPDTKEDLNKDYQSNHQERTHEDEQPDDPPIDQTQDFTAWLIDTFAKQGISLSPSKACALAQSICSHGLSDDDERRYVLDKLKQAVVSDKPTGQALYYMGNKSDVEQWKGDGGSDDGFFGLFD